MTNNKLPIEPFLPGDLIREELAARNWSQSDFAEILGRTDAFVSDIVTGKRGITIDTAQALGEAFGTSAQWWVNLETSYRLAVKQMKDEGSVSWRARLYMKAPIREMIKRGWIEPSKNIEVLEQQILKFLNIEDLDDEPTFRPHAARKSTRYGEITTAQIAWLSRASDLAPAAHAVPFAMSNVRFENMVQDLRLLMADPEEIRRVPALLAEVGIRLLVVEPLAGTKIDGACFWLDPESPTVVISMRYDRIAAFWHTLFHELAHLKYEHGPDDAYAIDVDLIGISSSEESTPKIEVRADTWAAEASIPQKELADFIARVDPLYSKTKIDGFAERIGVHPGIVVGQLQHRGNISWSHSREKLVKVRSILIQSALTDGWGLRVPLSER